ncbi:MAG: DNA polymerase III subunit [Bdellovibrionales bacterium]|nr:DNA polymerase III subunit [Bdellovibrionales bacterium]
MGLIWNQIFGQQKALTQLDQSLKNGRLSHAYLFVGPSAVGKKKTALALAQRILCESGNSCGCCRSCLKVEKGQSENLIILQNDSTELKNNQGIIKVEVIRQMIASLSLQIWQGSSRVVILDQAHEMNLQAANALLKTLEEPPSQTYFILVSSQPHQLPSTIKSRCQWVQFGRLLPQDMVKVRPFPAWVLDLSHGQLDWAEYLMEEEYQEVSRRSFYFWQSLFEKKEDLENLLSFLGDIEKRPYIMKHWSSFLHRARRFCAQGSPALEEKDSLDFKNEQTLFIKMASQPQAVDQTWIRFLELQSDFDVHVEKNLALENFYFSLKEIWQ